MKTQLTLFDCPADSHSRPKRKLHYFFVPPSRLEEFISRQKRGHIRSLQVRKDLDGDERFFIVRCEIIHGLSKEILYKGCHGVQPFIPYTPYHNEELYDWTTP